MTAPWRPDHVNLSQSSAELLELWPLGDALNLGWDYTEQIIVAGAYKGRVCRLLAERYSAAKPWDADPVKVFGFEPQPWAFSIASRETYHLPAVRLFPFAIGTATGEFPMWEWETDACSFVRVGQREKGVGQMIEASKVLMNLELTGAGWIMNMEGYEFDLLPHLHSFGALQQVSRLAVQWHRNLGNDGNYDQLQEWLRETHELLYDDAPRWQYWHLKTLVPDWLREEMAQVPVHPH